MAKMAILVDGGFYRVRSRIVNGRGVKTPQSEASELVAKTDRRAAVW